MAHPSNDASSIETEKLTEEATMAEKRNITKEDIHLEARLRAEGCEVEVERHRPQFHRVLTPR